jgi:hypothetical protein
MWSLDPNPASSQSCIPSQPQSGGAANARGLANTDLCACTAGTLDLAC